MVHRVDGDEVGEEDGQNDAVWRDQRCAGAHAGRLTIGRTCGMCGMHEEVVSRSNSERFSKLFRRNVV